jgi:predicted PurR-regulated permease PerM
LINFWGTVSARSWRLAHEPMARKDDVMADADAEDEARELAARVVEHAETDVFLNDTLVRDAAAGANAEHPYGLRGTPLSRRSPFMVAFVATLGVAAAAAIVEGVIKVWGVLVLILIAAFIAVGLDPVVGWLTRHRWRRGWAAAVVLLGALAVFAAFIASAVPAVSTEYHHLSTQIPHLLSRLQERHDVIGRAARRIHLSSSDVAKVVSFKGVLSVGRTLLSLAVSTLTVAVLTCYFLANLPAIKASAYRLVPRHRRARVGLLTDEILKLVGGYLLGNLITSVIAGGAMTIFLLALGVPDAVFLGLLVALFDLIPMIGAPIAGVIVALVALSVSLPTAIATVAFTLVFRVVEDYLLSPRVMRRTVEVAPVLVVVGVLLGAALLGILGALVAVPLVAAADLLRKEVVQPRLDET